MHPQSRSHRPAWDPGRRPCWRFWRKSLNRETWSIMHIVGKCYVGQLGQAQKLDQSHLDLLHDEGVWKDQGPWSFRKWYAVSEFFVWKKKDWESSSMASYQSPWPKSGKTYARCSRSIRSSSANTEDPIDFLLAESGHVEFFRSLGRVRWAASMILSVEIGLSSKSFGDWTSFIHSEPGLLAMWRFNARAWRLLRTSTAYLIFFSRNFKQSLCPSSTVGTVVLMNRVGKFKGLTFQEEASLVYTPASPLHSNAFEIFAQQMGLVECQMQISITLNLLLHRELQCSRFNIINNLGSILVLLIHCTVLGLVDLTMLEAFCWWLVLQH